MRMNAQGRRHRTRDIALIGLGILLGASVTTLASHQFSDVPTSAIYHEAVEWLFNRGITLGCSAGLYCPDDFVTRAQMALFMQRLGTALTPTFLTRTDNVGFPTVIDLDSLPNVCATTTNYIPTYPQSVVIHAGVSVEPTVAGDSLNYTVTAIYSLNGGVSWITASPGGSVPAKADNSAQWFPNFGLGFANLSPGLPYRFAARLSRIIDGTADIGAMYCRLFVEIGNRNPASSPLGPATLAPGQRR